AARDAIVPSFDGTPLIVTLHPAEGLAPGQRAPTILQTHGWGGSRETNPDAASSEQTGNVGVGPLRRAGFNVLTWDSRGFGDSGGIVSVDGPDAEGRDVQALLTWLAAQPEAKLDAPGDPRAGMHGVSYAGGIELVSAGLDRRIDVIAPTIAWHSLLTALYREDTAKSGWGTALYGAGKPAAEGDGLDSPAGPQTGGLDPHIDSAYASGVATGKFSAADRAWFDSRGPGALVENIRVPTFLVQGTADTLFTLSEAMRNAEILQRHDVPIKMMWFCGGHGACLTGSGPGGTIERAVVAWMRRYLAGDTSVSTGPQFEWLADDAVWRSTSSYPPPRGAPLTGDGSGTLGVNPADALSGTPIAAGPAANAINVPIKVRPAQVAGEPVLTLTYTATGTGASGHVFAQIVDGKRNLALGNQVTPIPIAVDGAAHTVTRSLEGVAAAVGADSRYTLQIVGGSQVYGPVRTTAMVTVSRAHVELPTVGGTIQTGRPGGVLTGGRRCTSRRRFVIHLRQPRGQRLVSARVTVAGKRVKVRRRHGRLTAVVNLQGKVKRTVRVRVVARTKTGRIVRETRRYRTCAGAPS
ncbi:MAG: type transport system ATP-binding protein, partial [Solirubrobacteraceae bacterium]|nr:type transport system ATP-binding protein [Solirubrobacteraceae bacterium]